MTIAPALDAYPVRLTPAEGESLMGYLWRFYVSNGHGLPSKVRTLASEVRSGRCCSADFRWTWSVIGRQVTEELLMSESGASNAIRQRSRLSWSKWPRTSRFCPACVREQQPHSLALDLPLVEACPTHGVVLVQSCTGCGASLCWSTLRYGWKCGCGLAVADMAAIEAPAWLRRASAMLATAATKDALVDAYATLVWLTELKHRIAHGDRLACQIRTSGEAPTRWLHRPGRWEIQTASQTMEVLAGRWERMLRHAFRTDRSPVVSVRANPHMSGLIDFLARATTKVRARMPALWAAWAEVHRAAMVHEARPSIIFHPRLSTDERRRNDAVLQAWWSRTWPFAGAVGERQCADVQGGHHVERADDLIARLVSDLIDLAQRPNWAVASSALAGRWRPCVTLADAGHSVAQLVLELGQLHSAELGFVGALAKQDLATEVGGGR